MVPQPSESWSTLGPKPGEGADACQSPSSALAATRGVGGQDSRRCDGSRYCTSHQH